MSITFEQKSHVINLLKKKYPDWDGFEHQAFRRDEINFKRSTVKKAVSLLSESTLAQLLVTRDTDSFINRLVRIGQATPLLQRNGSTNGDLEILYVSTLDKPVFCAQVYHLLHGTESVIDRLEAYFQYIEDHELPNTWTFPTYLLQFCYPDSEFFVEPRPTEWFLKYIGLAPKLGRPSADTYSAIKEFARELKISMAEYRPQDMIDIQSVIHVCSAMSEPAVHSTSPSFDADENFFQAPVGSPPAYNEFEPELNENFWAESQQLDNDPTMLFISDVSDESEDTVEHFYEKGNGATQSNGSASPDEHTDFYGQFKSFLTTYMSSPAGVARAAAYAKAREQAEQNFSHLIAEHELGEEVTDRVFLHLLPHADTENNNDRGAWVHPVHSAEDLIARLDQKYGNDLTVREQVAQVLLEFIRHCVYKANALEKSTEALERIDAISLIDVHSITPILHALKPTQYLLLHDASIPIINHFAGTNIHTRLQKLPELNAAGLTLIEGLRQEGLLVRFPSVQPTDLFDIFSHWISEQDQVEPTVEIIPPVTSHLETPPEQPVFREDENPFPPETQLRAEPVYEDLPPPPDDIDLPAPTRTTREVYTRQQCLIDTGVQANLLDAWYEALIRKGQVVFYGPAGTGKTYIATRLARSIADSGDGFCQIIQFHPNLTHADFVGDGASQPGVFRTFCAEAERYKDPCILVIDEVNRVNIAEVFGELLYQLEYRNSSIELDNPTGFYIPDNVYIIGTMRADRTSDILHDPVVRRRFALIPIEPDYELLKRFHAETNFQVDGLVRTLVQINERIDDPGLRIGTTFFLDYNLSQHIEEVWRYEIEPSIREAFEQDTEQIEAFTWSKIRRRLTR